MLTSWSFVLITIYYTDFGWTPVKRIVESSKTGAATNIIQGISVGLESTALPVVVITISILASYYIGRASGIVNSDGIPIGGLYGTAIATMGMLSSSAFILAMDVYGPITDNAGGIAEMANLSQNVRIVTDRLDAAGT
jgi:Na+/H+-translocating membrane pyrophosphatase